MARLFTKYIFLFFFGLIFIIGCEDSVESPIDDYSYYPLEVGRFQTYTVSETIYSVSAQEISKKYFIKERIAEILTDTEIRKVFKLERLKRLNSNQNWQIDSVMKVEWQPDRILRTENNLSFLKLIFPIQKSMQWNQNLYNTLPKVELTSSLQKNVVIGSKNYTDVVSVVERSDSSAISKTKRYELYAPQIGMIYKENTTLEYCQAMPACIGKGIIDAGIRRIIVLESYGIEK